MKRAAALVVMAALLAACGTTHVATTDPSARVYVNGELVGKGAGEIHKRGFPHGSEVTVMTDDGRRKQQSIRRSFTFVTFLLGFVTYGACWVVCWEYPDAVMVHLPPSTGGNTLGGTTASFTAAPAGDPWLQPPPGWQPHDAPAAPR